MNDVERKWYQLLCFPFVSFFVGNDTSPYCCFPFLPSALSWHIITLSFSISFFPIFTFLCNTSAMILTITTCSFVTISSCSFCLMCGSYVFLHAHKITGTDLHVFINLSLICSGTVCTCFSVISSPASIPISRCINIWSVIVLRTFSSNTSSNRFDLMIV